MGAEPERVVRHRHFRTAGLATGPSAVRDRVPLLFNADVALSLVRPRKEDAVFYRNAQGDEVVFVVEGDGVLESSFGELRYRAGDYVVIPRGILHRWGLGKGPHRFLVIESAGYVRTPKRYRNEHGQLTEMAPFSERDIRRPERLLPHDETGEFTVLVKSGNRLVEMVMPHHPFDVVGWDGYYYPWAFSIHDFEPRVGRVHLPPPVHQTFEGDGFVICSFCPRPFDFEKDAVSAPYSHQNVMSDEVLFYANSEFMSRKGIELGSITLHPDGLPHGPQPGKTEESIGAKSTNELAVMVDTFRPLLVSREALGARGRLLPTLVAHALVVTSRIGAAPCSAGLVDYAGLFPPAALSMDAAVAEYARWRRSPEAFMLGRFVVPAARLVELGRAADVQLPEPGAGEPWRLSALAGRGRRTATRRASTPGTPRSAGRGGRGRGRAQGGEPRAGRSRARGAARRAHGLRRGRRSTRTSTACWRRSSAAARGRRSAPAASCPRRSRTRATLARFIAACAAAGVAWKATAGLHHPLRAEQALTYEPASPRATMHGFLNVFARGGLRAGGRRRLAELDAVLRERLASAFRLDDEGLAWRQLRASTARSRRRGATSRSRSAPARSPSRWPTCKRSECSE